LKAFCSVLSKNVRKLGLNVVSDTSHEQHKRHANIINFTEAKKRQLADELASIATKNESLVILENHE